MTTLAALTAGTPYAFLPTEYEEALAKRWAKANGFGGAKGGWIWRLAPSDRDPSKLVAVGSRPVCQGWWRFWRLKRSAILNALTREVTGLTGPDAFQQLTHPKSTTYRPTLLVRSPRDWKVDALACAYDEAMKAQGDPRRAYRGARDGMSPADRAVLLRRFVVLRESQRALGR